MNRRINRGSRFWFRSISKCRPILVFDNCCRFQERHVFVKFQHYPRLKPQPFSNFCRNRDLTLRCQRCFHATQCKNCMKETQDSLGVGTLIILHRIKFADFSHPSCCLVYISGLLSESASLSASESNPSRSIR